MAERPHIQKMLRAPFTVRECLQVSHRPTWILPTYGELADEALRRGCELSAFTSRSKLFAIPYFFASSSTFFASSGYSSRRP